MTKLALIYGDRGYVHQWDLDGGGRPACLLDGIPPTDPKATAALQKSIAVQALVDLVEPYEAAQVIAAKGEPDNGQPKQIPDPKWKDPGDGSTAPLVANPAWALQPTTITTTDETGKQVSTPNPNWTAYNDAQALISAASDATKALALWRSPEPATTDPAYAAWDQARQSVTAAITSATSAALDAALPDLKIALKDQIDARCASVLTAGFTAPAGTLLAGKVLQTRDNNDRTNWLTSQASYSAAVAAGQGATMGAEFRTADNAIIILSYSDGLNVLLAMAAWGKAVMGNAWKLKDQIRDAATRADLEAIDITQGWPA